MARNTTHTDYEKATAAWLLTKQSNAPTAATKASALAEAVLQNERRRQHWSRQKGVSTKTKT